MPLVKLHTMFSSTQTGASMVESQEDPKVTVEGSHHRHVQSH